MASIEIHIPQLVAVPKGMSTHEAHAAMAAFRPWVEVSHEVSLPTGTRIREEWTFGEPEIKRWVHPDDAPDPDAELIDDLSHALARSWMETTTWGSPPNVPDPVWANLARVAIERVRGVSA